ncbi:MULTISPECIES: cupin domain-containing protein [Anaerolinea]|uniref:cupin domain-containing protein n=1 Tax=Anaerolinea TaxID=233189 RepID=UPI002636F7E5|nr:cupin domain-containing protein [Anaerolinea thermophila]
MESKTGFFFSERGQGVTVWFLGTRMQLRANGDHTNGSFGLIEQVLPPGFSPPVHVHHGEDEAFYLLEGEASFTCGDETVHAHPGTLIFFPRGIPHWFRITGDQQARLIQFNFPAGLENFFIEAGEVCEDSKPHPITQEGIEKMLHTAIKYQIEILGPPPQ